jgi:hypothetical protein
MSRMARLVILGVLLAITGSGLAREDAKKKGKEDAPKLREWTVRHVEWVLTDQKKIELWKKGKDKSIPKDAKEIATVRVFRKDDEKSVVIVSLGKEAVVARFVPWKDDEGSYTTVRFFYRRGIEGDDDHLSHGRTCDVSMDDKQLTTGTPIIIGSGAHGIRNDKGGYKSFTVRVTTVTVKEIDQKGVDKAVDAYTPESKLPK